MAIEAISPSLSVTVSLDLTTGGFIVENNGHSARIPANAVGTQVILNMLKAKMYHHALGKAETLNSISNPTQALVDEFLKTRKENEKLEQAKQAVELQELF